jgi:hypothetical protein
MPTVLRIKGHRFFFFSNEGNEPPHIHIETADKYAKFWINPIVLATSIGYNSKELREIHQIIEEYKNLFEEKWHEYFGS